MFSKLIVTHKFRLDTVDAKPTAESHH